MSIIYVCFYEHNPNSSQGSWRSLVNTHVRKQLVKGTAWLPGVLITLISAWNYCVHFNDIGMVLAWVNVILVLSSTKKFPLKTDNNFHIQEV